MYVSTIKLEYI